MTVISAAVLWNQSLIHWRENVLDSYLFGFYGWRIVHDGRPYLDVWDNKPPGIWWANALAFSVAGDGPTADWLVGGTALFVSLLAFVGVVHALWHASIVFPALIVGILLLTHVSFECGANRTETLVVMCELSGVFCYSRTLKDLSRGESKTLSRAAFFWLIAAGVFLGCSPWCKQSGVGALIAVGIHCALISSASWKGRFARMLAISIGFVVAQLTAAGLLLRDRAFGDALFAMFRFNRFYFEIGDATWTNIDGAIWAYRGSLPPLEMIATLAVVASVCTIGRFFWKGNSTDSSANQSLALFWIWLLVGGYFALVGVGRLSYHLMPILPPLGLILVALIGRFGGAGGLVRGILRRPSLAAYVVMTLAATLHCARFGFRDSAQCAARRPLDAGWWPMTPPQYARQAAEIQRWASPADTVYVWGWSPGTYRFAYRANACRFATLEKMGQLGERVRFIQDEVVRTLREKPPAVIAISEGDLGGMREAAKKDEFARWVVESYQARGEVEGMHILRRVK